MVILILIIFNVFWNGRAAKAQEKVQHQRTRLARLAKQPDASRAAPTMGKDLRTSRSAHASSDAAIMKRTLQKQHELEAELAAMKCALQTGPCYDHRLQL